MQINIQNLLASNSTHKIIFSDYDLSIEGQSAAQGHLSYLVDKDLNCTHICFDYFGCFGDLSTNAPFSFSQSLDLSKINSDDEKATAAEFNKFLNSVQLWLLFKANYCEDFLDKEYEQLTQIYPNFSVIDMDENLDTFANQTFKCVESVDNTTTTVFGFINETMYYIDKKINPQFVKEIIMNI